MDIQHGKSKVVIVGNAEAPVIPEIMEGFRVMGALAEDAWLKALDNSDEILIIAALAAHSPQMLALLMAVSQHNLLC